MPWRVPMHMKPLPGRPWTTCPRPVTREPRQPPMSEVAGPGGRWAWALPTGSPSARGFGGSGGEWRGVGYEEGGGRGSGGGGGVGGVDGGRAGGGGGGLAGGAGEKVRGG